MSEFKIRDFSPMIAPSPMVERNTTALRLSVTLFPTFVAGNSSSPLADQFVLHSNLNYLPSFAALVFGFCPSGHEF
jgi:hypothetical protein